MAVKRKSRFVPARVTNRQFHSSYIFRSGLEELLEILEQEQPLTIQISDDEYEYESLAELLDKYNGKEISTITFMATFPDGVHITVSRKSISFHASETTPKTL